MKTPQRMGRLLMRGDRWRERPTFSEHFIFISSRLEGPEQIQFAIKAGLDMAAHSLGTVSYTHLTLPTIYSV